MGFETWEQTALTLFFIGAAIFAIWSLVDSSKKAAAFLLQDPDPSLTPGTPEFEERQIHRALVEAGYAPLDEYVRIYGEG